MARISDSASNTALIRYMLQTQQRMRNYDQQVASGKISSRYSGPPLSGSATRTSPTS